MSNNGAVNLSGDTFFKMMEALAGRGLSRGRGNGKGGRGRDGTGRGSSPARAQSPKGDSRKGGRNEPRSKADVIAKRISASGQPPSPFMGQLFEAFANHSDFAGPKRVVDWVLAGCPVSPNYAQQATLPLGVNIPANIGGFLRLVEVSNSVAGEVVLGMSQVLLATPPNGAYSFCVDGPNTRFLVWERQDDAAKQAWSAKWSAKDLEDMLFHWAKLPPYRYVYGGAFVDPAVMPMPRFSNAIDGWNTTHLCVIKRIMTKCLDGNQAQVPTRLIANDRLAPGAILTMASRVGAYNSAAAAAVPAIPNASIVTGSA